MQRTHCLVVVAAASCFSFAAGALASDLDGTWTSACNTDASGAITNGAATYSGTNAALDSTQYADAACATPVVVTHLKAAYATEAASGGVTPLDYTVAGVTAVIPNADYVAQFNSQKVCGFNDWAVNVEKDIAGLSCGGGTIPKVGDRTYDIYQITNGQLFFGDSSAAGHDGSTAATRPVAIDNKTAYSKSAL